MDELSYKFVDMVAGQNNDLYDDSKVSDFMGSIRLLMEKSSLPKRNFLIDTSTPHGDAVITESSVMKPGIGWITLQSTEGIRRGIHEWCIKIENQGETNDGSGLMLGVVPKTFNKFDSFISQGGGWCLSRAGKFYGHWRRQDGSTPSLTFETGDRVIFILDVEASRMTVRVGDKCVIGDMSNLTSEVFPAVSLHYRHQHVRFEYHIVHDQQTSQLGWEKRQLLPCAASRVPLRPSQLESLVPDSYVFSPLFSSRQTPNAKPATHRFTILANAFAAVRHHAAALESSEQFCDVTAEYLRSVERHALLQRTDTAGWHAASASANASLTMSSLVVVRLFESVVRGSARRSTEGVSTLPIALVDSVIQYLLTRPPGSMSECKAQALPPISEETLVAVSSLLETGMSAYKEETADHHSSSQSVLLYERLLELLVLVALQSARVVHLLRVARSLFRVPDWKLSKESSLWLYRHESAFLPRLPFPDIGKALADASASGAADHDDTFCLASSNPLLRVFSVCYMKDAVVVHSEDGLRLFDAQDPAGETHACEGSEYYVGASYSSVMFHRGSILLHTDLMSAKGILFCVFDTKLRYLRHYRAEDVGCAWLLACSITLKWCSLDNGLLVVAQRSEVPPTAAEVRSPVGQPPSKTDLSDLQRPLELLFFSSISATDTPRITSRLPLRVPDAGRLTFDHCLSIPKAAYVQLGAPEDCLTVTGGFTTVEVWVRLLDKESSASFYQHGDPSASGEVFMEVVKIEGACCIRAGYRHETRGSCVVMAPVPPSAAESEFMHVALVFNGSWRLFFDGSEVAANRHGPFVALDAPQRYWTLGGQCTCLIAGLRVWRCGRDPRQIDRDRKRPLAGTEYGLVCQYLFNEEGGNTCLNYCAYAHARHGVGVGPVEFVKTGRHPFADFPVEHTTTAGLCSHELNATVIYRAPWPLRDQPSPKGHVTYYAGRILLSSRVSPNEESLFSPKCAGCVFSCFDVNTGTCPNAIFFLPDKSSARGFIGADEAGSLFDLFHSEQHVDWGDRRPSAVPPSSAPPGGSRATLVAKLPFPHFFSSRVTGARHAMVCSEPLMPYLPQRAALSSLQPSIPCDRITCADVGNWMLSFLSLHATSVASAPAQLYSPFCDDVSTALVDELRSIFVEHIRVVRGSNARRTMIYKNRNTSIAMLSTALKVLHRLVYSVRAFKLHPSTLGLALSADSQAERQIDINAVLRVFQSARRNEEDEVGGPHSAVVPAAGTLLAGLGDIINEASHSLKAELKELAETVLVEGVDLFVPIPRLRAEMLMKMLQGATNSGAGKAPSKEAVKQGDSRSVADISLTRALQLSLSSIEAASMVLASPAVRPGTAAARSTTCEAQDSLAVLGKTCSCLLQDSPGDQSRSGDASSWSLTDCLSTAQLVFLASVQRDKSEFQGMNRKYEENLLFYVDDDGASPDYSTVVKDYYSSVFMYVERVLTNVKEKSGGCREGGRASSLSPKPPLYVAITAIPLVMCLRDATWFLKKLKDLTSLIQKMGLCKRAASKLASSEAASPQTFCDAVVFTYIWVAVCVSSCTSMPSLGGTSSVVVRDYETAAAASPKLAALDKVCSHPLLHGGLRPAHCTQTNTRFLIIKRVIVEENAARWSAWQKRDALGAKMSETLSQLMVTVGAAALYLSNTIIGKRNSGAPSTGEIEELLVLFEDVLKRLKPLRNELLSRKSDDLQNEIREKTQLLFNFVSCTETPFLVESLYCTAGPSAVKNTSDGSRWWRTAYGRVRSGLLRQRLDIWGSESLCLSTAVAFVSELAISAPLGITAKEIEARCMASSRTAAMRAEGLRCLSHVGTTIPHFLSSIAEATKQNFSRNNTHYEDHLAGSSIEALGTLRSLYPTPLVVKCCALDPEMNSATLADFLKQKWAPRDLQSFARVGVVSQLFKRHCSIFADNVSDSKSCARASIAVDETEMKHRAQILALHLESVNADSETRNRGGAGPPLPAGSQAIELGPRELGCQRALASLKDLGLQSAQLLHKALYKSEVLAVLSFIDALFSVFAAEIELCSQRLTVGAKDTDNTVIELVEHQVVLVASLCSCVVAGLPDDYIVSTTVCGQALLRTVNALVSALQTRVNSSRNTEASTSFFVVACHVLAHCSPYAAHERIRDAARGKQKLTSDACGSGVVEPNAALVTLLSLCELSICGSGLNSSSQAMLGAIRGLMARPQWTKQIAGLHHLYSQDVLRLSSLLTAEIEENGRNQRPATPKQVAALQRCSVKQLVWVSALGAENSLRFPAAGERVRFQSRSGSNGGSSGCVREGYIIYCDEDLSGTALVALLENENGKETASSDQVWVSINELLMPRLSDGDIHSPTRPRLNRTLPEAVVLQFTSSITALLRGQVQEGPAPLLPEWRPYSPTHLLIFISLVDIMRHFAVALDHDSIFCLCEYALILERMTAETEVVYPFPFDYMREFSALAVKGECTRCALESSSSLAPDAGESSSTTPSPEVTGAALTDPLRNPSSLHPSNRRRIRNSAIAFASASTLSPQSRIAPVLNSEDTPTLVAGSPRPPLSWGEQAAATEAIPGTGACAVSSGAASEPNASLSLLSFCVSPGHLCPGGVRIEGGFPRWTNGMCVETALLLCDHAFPDLGEDFLVCSSLEHPGFAFPVFTLTADAGAGGGGALLRFCVRIANGSLVCTVDVDEYHSEMSLPIVANDWDGFLHIALIIERSVVSLVKSAEVATSPLPAAVGSVLESRLSAKNTCVVLTMGDPEVAQPNSSCANQDIMILVSGLRVWGSSLIKSSIKYISELVARDQALPPSDVHSEHALFKLDEGTGDLLHSHDRKCHGKLMGAAVRWVSCHFKTIRCPLRPDVSDKLFSGVPQNTEAQGLFVPREELAQFLTLISADQFGLARVFGTFLALVTRKDLRALWERIVTQRLVVSPTRRPRVFDFIPRTAAARALINTFRYSEGPALSVEDVEAVQRLTRCILEDELQDAEWQREEGVASPRASSFVAELRDQLMGLQQEEMECATLDLFVSPKNNSKDLVMPIFLSHTGAGVLSFGNGGHGIDQAVVYRDASQKSVLIRFPNSQGGWPECVLQEGVGWHYLCLQGVTGAAAISLSFTVHSSFALLLRLILHTLSEHLKCARENSSSAREASSCPLLEPLLNARVLSFLVQQISASSTSEAVGGLATASTLHEVGALNAIMDIWRLFPEQSPFDQSPLNVLLAHINLPLVGLFQRGLSGAHMMLSPLGSFNAHTQALIGLVYSAIQLSAVWRRTTYRTRVRHRWGNFCETWISCARRRTTEGNGDVQTMEFGADDLLEEDNIIGLVNDVAESETTAKMVAVKKKGGAWQVRCAPGQKFSTMTTSVGFTRGRFYFEVRLLDNNAMLQLGVVSSGWNGSPLGQDGESWVFDSVRMCRMHANLKSEFPIRVKWKAGDVIGVLADLESNRITCIHNDRQTSSFEAFRTTPGDAERATCFFPVFSFSSGSYEVNLGTAPFLASLPVGFMPVHPHYFITWENTQFWFMDILSRWSAGLSATTSTAAAAGCMNEGNIEPSCNELVDYVCGEVLSYCDGRSGPLAVDVLSTPGRLKSSAQTPDAPVDDLSVVAKGNVAVRSGRWYYEAVVTEGANFSLGWAAATDGGGEYTFNEKGTTLGDDTGAWVLEGKRMIAKHNKHQTNIARHMWKDGDVVGCLVDCDKGVMSFSINGVFQRELHAEDNEKNTCLFTGISVPQAGLLPIAGLESRSSVVFLWYESEISYLPKNCKPLGATTAVHQAVVRGFLRVDRVPVAASSGSNGSSSPPSLASLSLEMKRLVRFITESTNLDPRHSLPWLMPALTELLDGDDANALHMSNKRLKVVTALCHLASFALQCLCPYAYAASVPHDVATDKGLNTGELSRCFKSLLEHAFPYFGLSVVCRYKRSVESVATDALKLTVNRRKALAVFNNASVRDVSRVNDSLFGQIYSLLKDKPSALFRTDKKLWSVSFVGEGADDVGGPFRESITQICTELMSPLTLLFRSIPNHNTGVGEGLDTLVPYSRLQPSVEIGMYRFIGRLIGGCLRSGEPLPLYFPSSVWREMAGAPADDFEDLERLDAATLSSLRHLQNRAALLRDDPERLDAELTESCPGGFTVQDDDGDEYSLVPGGENVRVTHSNWEFYVSQLFRCKLDWIGKEQRNALCLGFHEVVPICVMRALKWYELEALVCGLKDYDPDCLIDGAEYQNLTPDDATVQYLRLTLRDFTPRQRALFMRFVTGRERLPPGTHLRLIRDTALGVGAAAQVSPLRPTPPQEDRRSSRDPPRPWRYANLPSSSSSSESKGSFEDTRLPHASTCFFWLYLPQYSSQDVMRKRLTFVIEQCQDIDADFRLHDNDLTAVESGPAIARLNAESDNPFEDFSHLQ